MKIILSLVIMCIMTASIAQPATTNTDILYGAITRQHLMTGSNASWYVSGSDAYHSSPSVLQSIQKLNTKDVTIEVFLGTWCGDSKREVPRFMKLLQQLSFPEKNLKIVGLGGGDSLYKRSPGGEETGKGIFRVPVFIFYRNGTEINRINEFPVLSLEKDMYTILSNQSYTANYQTFGMLKKWLADSTLVEKNVNVRGLAMQLKGLPASDRELNSLGYFLLGQEKKEEALRVFQINAVLYPESANVLSSLGEGYIRNGDAANAALYLERSLEINKDPILVKEILKLLYEVKGVKLAVR